jgi:hypothetical protein
MVFSTSSATPVLTGMVGYDVNMAGLSNTKIFSMPVGQIYPHYVDKVVRKSEKTGRTQADLDQVIEWLTGYDEDELHKALAENVSFEEFFDNAPAFNPRASEIKGIICGVRVENIEDPLMQKIRMLDKLADEVAAGKKMTSIMREPN